MWIFFIIIQSLKCYVPNTGDSICSKWLILWLKSKFPLINEHLRICSGYVCFRLACVHLASWEILKGHLARADVPDGLSSSGSGLWCHWWHTLARGPCAGARTGMETWRGRKTSSCWNPGGQKRKRMHKAVEKKAIKTWSILWNYDNTAGASTISEPFGWVLYKRTLMTLVTEVRTGIISHHTQIQGNLTVRGSNSIWLKCRLCGGTENE